MRKTVFLLFFSPALFYWQISFGQNEEDILRYSYASLFGDARNLALGGAMGTVGANISSAAVNPAGLGMFRGSQYSFAIGYTAFNTSSRYIGEIRDGSRGTINIPQFGLVLSTVNSDKGKDKTKGLVAYNFLIGFNRINNFNRMINFSGVNTSSPIIHAFAESAYGSSLDDLATYNTIPGLAYYTYLFDSNGNTSYPYDYIPYLPDSVSIRQTGSIESRGRNNELNLGAGFNISNTLYFGIGFSFNTIFYENITVFSEETHDRVTPPRSMRYESGFTSGGSGISGKFGLIYRFSDQIRLGMSYQTPLTFALQENYYLKMRSTNFFGQETISLENSDEIRYEYKLTTPSSFTAGLTYTWKKAGIICAEAGYIDYGSGYLYAADYDYAVSNNIAKNTFAKAWNIKVGTEYLIGPYRIRAGFAHLGSPYQSAVLKDDKTSSRNYCLGFGYKNREGFFADLAVVHSRQRLFHTPYVLQNTDRESYTVTQDMAVWNTVITIGSTF